MAILVCFFLSKRLQLTVESCDSTEADTIITRLSSLAKTLAIYNDEIDQNTKLQILHKFETIQFAKVLAKAETLVINM